MQEELDLLGEPENPEETAAEAAQEAEREAYRRRLEAMLQDPEFRKIEGFPVGTNEAILRLSDPPYYTACPNPFLEEWVAARAKPFDPETDAYHREPFAADVSEGKSHPLYSAHSYHTKVPHRAIMRYLLHYTDPGDLVWDGFCGTGMTGVAAQLCGDRDEVAALGYQVRDDGAILDEHSHPISRLGSRKAILSDLSPAATFIAYNYNTPVDVGAFEREAQRILRELDAEWGWMYETRRPDGSRARINYTVWGELFRCPECSEQFNFAEAALEPQTQRVRESISCPSCSAEFKKRDLKRDLESYFDPHLGHARNRSTFSPILVSSGSGKLRADAAVSSDDLERLQAIATRDGAPSIAPTRFPIERMCHGSCLAPKGYEYVHDLYLPRALRSLVAIWSKAGEVADDRLRRFVLFAVEQTVWGLSLLNRYVPTHFSQVNRYLSGVYYISSMVAEVSPWYILDGKVARLKKAFHQFRAVRGNTLISTGSCDATRLPPNSLDYIFTDPPFGKNIYYADMNYLIESWHEVITQAEPEAIIDPAKHKRLAEYQQRMARCFARYFEALKPGRWMTVEFHNSANSVWNAIQEGLEAAGFVVADVRVLSKEQASFRQVTAAGAVKQDLVISCYKPRTEFSDRFPALRGQPSGAVEFIRQHLEMLPVAPLTRDGQIEALAERGRYLLFDRMVAYHLRCGARIPLSAAEFYRMLEDEFVARDGMYFLPDQAARYDAVRVSTDIEPLSLFVKDERTAVQWVRAQLAKSPQTLGELTPAFMQQVQAVDGYESLPELRELLRENFILGADGTWRVANPENEKDLEAIRRKGLLKVFEGYVKEKGALKVFRKEAVLEGFRTCWSSTPRQYGVIVAIAERIPAPVLAEIHELQQFYDIAREFPPTVQAQLTFTWEG